MGKLARVGITEGRLVPVDGLAWDLSVQKSDNFVVTAFERFGVSETAADIIASRPLSVEQIEFLLAKASFPILLKLVELRKQKVAGMKPTPIVVLPIGSWVATYGLKASVKLAVDFLCSFDSPSLQVVLEDLQSIDSAILELGLYDAIREIHESRAGVVLVGPSVEDILKWIGCIGVNQDEVFHLVELERVLYCLKQAGVSRLRYSSNKYLLKLLNEVGLSASILTDIGVYSTHTKMAEELYALGQLSEDCRIDVWMPGLIAQDFSADSATDLKLLRTLAVGTLALPRISYRRASSRFFSREGLSFAKFCGANDYGFGAVDELTERRLGVARLDLLSKVIA